MGEIEGRLHRGDRIEPARLGPTPHGAIQVRTAGGMRLEAPAERLQARDAGWRGDRIIVHDPEAGWAFEVTEQLDPAHLADRLPSPLRERAQAAARRIRGRRRRRLLLLALAVAVPLALVHPCVTWSLRSGGPWAAITALVPHDWDQAAGRALERELEREGCLRPVDDEASAAANDLLLFLLAGDEREEGVEWRVRIRRDSEPNAFAAPGGLVVLHEGLVASTDGPALLGVLAHEIAHVRRRHPTQALLRRAGLSLALSSVFGRSDPSFLGGLALELVLLRYSRRQERQADDDAVARLVRAGVDPTRFAHWLAQIDREEETPFSSWLSTHPDPKERAARILQRSDLPRGLPLPEEAARAYRRLRSALGPG